ncbi:MerR family transcriptional regulator [Massilia sp. Root351]|uniref:MerR family transcriptional regulator n=1 Tax=Massilia sp. Root351 TaxID=1736522 RepID=UPI000B160047|nr:MerR family transcriptional regulator [Massilia sp. Root351]
MADKKADQKTNPKAAPKTDAHGLAGQATAGAETRGAYRSGVAARLAGLPVETLRVWERRYSVSGADRSPHGQRLYSAEQVRRLGLLKRVVDLGHPIGTVAALPFDELAAMARALPPAPELAREGAAAPLRVAVVGAAMARRLASVRTEPALDIVHTCATLDAVPASLPGVAADVLLIESSEMSADTVPLIAAARAAVPGAALVVMYRFCDSATVRRLREQGCLVARVPADPAEVAVLCSSALAGLPLQSLPVTPPAPPRRLDEQALAILASAPNSINCECPRHLADILMILGSFERYSQQCAARNEDDAALHQELSNSAGHARVMLETALERLARADGLPLPPSLDE